MENIIAKIEEIQNMPSNNDNDKKNIEKAWYEYVESLGQGI